MAIDVKPSTYFGAGYSLSGNTIVLNTNDAASDKLLSKLSNAKANATTGDARQVALAIVEALYAAYVAQRDNNNKPKQMSVQTSASRDSSGNFNFAYTFNFTFTESGTWTVVAE